MPIKNLFITIFKLKKDQDIGGQIGGRNISDLTNRQIEVLDLIVLNKNITRREISFILKIAESAVQKHIKILINK